MAAAKRTVLAPAAAFASAVKTADHLDLKAGLQAIKKSEGAGQIVPTDPKKVLGSVAMDDDCLEADPNGNRWDYVVGYEQNSGAFAYFVEVHSAQTSKVSEVEKKLDWLLRYLQGEAQKQLASMPHAIHWVASGSIDIPKHLPQYKKLNSTLRKKGLLGPTKHLTLT
jgi:hypothetical protein